MSPPLFTWSARERRIVVFSLGCLRKVACAIDELAYDCRLCTAVAMESCEALSCPLRSIVLELR